MDEKTIANIRAAHEAAKGEMPACSVGLDAHRHRGILLDAVAGMRRQAADEERAACAAEVRQEIKSAQRVVFHTEDERRAAVRFLGYALKHIEERGAASLPERMALDAGKGAAPRPRVGPWVKGLRFDDRGQEVGGVCIGAVGWRWWACRPFLPSTGNDAMSECETEEQARAACAAVLAMWADFDGMPAADTLSQARALLQRARKALWKLAPRSEADVVNGPTWQEFDALAPAIDAFLAGLP